MLLMLLKYSLLRNYIVIVIDGRHGGCSSKKKEEGEVLPRVVWLAIHFKHLITHTIIKNVTCCIRVHFI